MNGLRLSDYTIPVELESNEGKFMLIHGYTGALDVIGRDVLEQIRKNPLEGSLSSNAIDRLLKRGYLTTKDKEEEQMYVERFCKILSKRNKLLLKKNFTLVVTYNCNFNCPYCFEKELMGGKYKNVGKTISKKLVDNFFDTIPIIEPNKYLRNNVISLFGGEPLLEENIDLVKYIVDQGKERGYVFTATTNGYDLPVYENLLGNKLIQGVQITIDGCQSVHDSRRMHSIYGETFNKITRNIKYFLSKGVFVRVRINIDEDNIDELDKLDSYFKENKLYDFERFSVYAAYISGDLNFNPRSYQVTKRKCITQRYFLEKLKKYSTGITFEQQLYSNFYNAIKNSKVLNLSPSHCNARFGSYIFDPFGNIYSCLEAIGTTDDVIGTYYNELRWNKENKDKWFNQEIGLDEECKKCKYILLCGRGCYAKNRMADKKGEKCDDFPIRLRSVARKVYSDLKGF